MIWLEVIALMFCIMGATQSNDQFQRSLRNNKPSLLHLLMSLFIFGGAVCWAHTLFTQVADSPPTSPAGSASRPRPDAPPAESPH